MAFTNLILFQRGFFLLCSLSFFHQLLLAPLTPPSFSSSLFLPVQLFLPVLNLPHHFPCGFQRHPAIFLFLHLSVLPFSLPNGIPGEHVSLSSFALYNILTYRCEVNEMEFKNDPFLPSLPYLQYHQPNPLSFKISLFLCPCCYVSLNLNLYFLCFMPQKTV